MAATFITLLMLQPIMASANGGPLVNAAGGYGLLQLDEQSAISLVREKVIFDIGQRTNPYETEANVSVAYELHNQDEVRTTVDIIFLTPAQGNLMVTEGSKRLPSAEAADPRLVNWAPGMKDNVIEPISGKQLPMRGSSYGQEAVGTQFSLTFEPNETKSIVIRYTDRGGMYDRGVINTIYSHLYYLSPAKFWEGKPFVELEIRLPDLGNTLHSNLPLVKVDSVTYKADFNDLPEGEWYFSYAESSRILFPTNMEKDHNLLVLGTSAVGAILAAGAALLLRRNSIYLVSAAGIFIFIVYYITKMGGYPFNGIFVGITDVMAGAMLMFGYTRVRRRNRRSTEKSAEDRSQSQ